MSMFIMKKESMDIHTGMMKTRGSGTTTWYAFEDPKTGREYFHEPVSDKTSWVRPTSSNSTRIERAGSGLPKSAVKEVGGRAMEGEDTKSQRKQLSGWSAAGIIVSILFFNTLFLLVLVKILYENTNLPGQINHQINLPAQAHEKGVELNLPTEKEVIVEADLKSVQKDKAFLPNAWMDNAAFTNGGSSIEDEEEENTITAEKPSGSSRSPEASSDNHSLSDVTELNGEEKTLTGAAAQEGGASDQSKGAAHDEEPSYFEEKEVLNKDGDKGKWGAVLAAVLVKKCQQVRKSVAHFFNRVLAAVRRMVSGR